MSLVGRHPDAGRGLDVYADQTLLDAIWGRAGRVPNAPPDTPMEWNPRLRPPSDGPSPVPAGRPPARWGRVRASVAGCPTSMPPPPPPCTPSHARPCLPRSTRAGPIQPACTGRGDGPGCCWTRPGRPRRRPWAAVRTSWSSPRRGRRRCTRELPGLFRGVGVSAAIWPTPRSNTRRCSTRRRPMRRTADRSPRSRWTAPGRWTRRCTARPCGRTPRWPASSRPTTRWAPNSRWRRSARSARRRGCRSWWTPPSRSAGARSPRAGRC